MQPNGERKGEIMLTNERESSEAFLRKLLLMYLCNLPIHLRLSSYNYQVPGNGNANSLSAKRGHEPSHSFKDLAARGSGSSFDAGPLGNNYQGNGAHSRQHTTERAGANSGSNNSKDKGNKQLEDIRRMLNRKEEVSKSAGRTNSLIDKFEKQSSAAGSASRYGGGGGGGNSSDEDDDDHASHPNSGYNSSARVSRVSSFDYDDDDDGGEDHEGQEVCNVISSVVLKSRGNVSLAYLSIQPLFPNLVFSSSLFPYPILLFLLLTPPLPFRCTKMSPAQVDELGLDDGGCARTAGWRQSSGCRSSRSLQQGHRVREQGTVVVVVASGQQPSFGSNFTY